MPDAPLFSRREFAERLALAAAAPLVALDLPLAGVPRGDQRKPAAQESEPSALARTLAEGIRLRYGDRLTQEDLKTITRAIDSRLQNLERLYQVALANADEPDFVFSVYRRPD